MRVAPSGPASSTPRSAKAAAPSATSTVVRSPAERWRHCRSAPMSVPSRKEVRKATKLAGICGNIVTFLLMVQAAVEAPSHYGEHHQDVDAQAPEYHLLPGAQHHTANFHWRCQPVFLLRQGGEGFFTVFVIVAHRSPHSALGNTVTSPYRPLQMISSTITPIESALRSGELTCSPSSSRSLSSISRNSMAAGMNTVAMTWTVRLRNPTGTLGSISTAAAMAVPRIAGA